MTNLGSKALLVSMHATCWSAKKVDADVSRSATDAYGADAEAGRFLKNLIQNEHLEEVKKLQRQARSTHTVLTMPWDDRGARLLPIQNHTEYQQTMDDLILKMSAEKKRFMGTYGDSIENARVALGRMFHEEEYPSVDGIDERIGMTYEFSPVPDRSHLESLVGSVPEITLESLRQATDRQVQIKLTEATNWLYGWVHEIATYVEDRLTPDPETGRPKVFQVTMVKHLERLSANLDGFNMIEDPMLKRIAEDLEPVVDSIGGNANRLREGSCDFSNLAHDRTYWWAKHTVKTLDTYFGVMKEVSC